MESSMTRVHTHYDNLKIARNAPPEVVKAAYRVLAQKYHPDKHPGNRDAIRVMALVNESYGVLSDPARRKQHDEWIELEERSAAPAPQERQTDTAKPEPTPPPSRPRWNYEQPPRQTRDPNWEARFEQSATAPPSRSWRQGYFDLDQSKAESRLRFENAVFFLLPVGLMALLFVLLLSTRMPTVRSTPVAPPVVASPAVTQARPMDVASQQPAAASESSPKAAPLAAAACDVDVDVGCSKPPAQIRPLAPPIAPKLAPPSWALAPDGSAWPSTASYLAGGNIGARGGLSTLTVDNTRTSFAVHVKVFSIGHSAFVRSIFIPAGTSFRATDLLAGSYEVRYRNLSTGDLFASQPFELIEQASSFGTDYSDVTMTLYRVSNGNMRTHSISEQDF